MTKNQKEILKAAADLYISTISNSIITKKPNEKEKGRGYLKEVIDASDCLENIKLED